MPIAPHRPWPTGAPHPAAVLAGWLMAAGPASACSCAAPEPLPVMVNQAALVATGRVLSVRPAERIDTYRVGGSGKATWRNQSSQVVRFELMLDEVFHGAADARTVTLQTLAGPGDCGRLEPREGEHLLLFVYAVSPAAMPGAPPALTEARERANAGLPRLEATGGRCSPSARVGDATGLLTQLRALRQQRAGR